MPDLVIIPSAEFCRQTKRLAKKYRSLAADLTAFQEMITKNPFVGTDLGGGKRKIRLAVTSKAKGKSDMTNQNIQMYQINILIK